MRVAKPCEKVLQVIVGLCLALVSVPSPCSAVRYVMAGVQEEKEPCAVMLIAGTLAVPVGYGYVLVQAVSTPVCASACFCGHSNSTGCWWVGALAPSVNSRPPPM